MTPQEKELIQNVADKLKAIPNKPKDPEADALISQEIASQEDIVYKLTQAVLVQEMALKDMKSKNDFLESQVEHFRKESERGTLSRMMGGTTPAPVQPQPVRQPSAFGGFMQTAASVAAGMVAGHLISNALFGDDEPTAEATPEADTADTQTADAGTSTDESADSSFLGDDSGFASEYSDTSSDFGADTLANNGFGEEESFGGFGDDEDF